MILGFHRLFRTPDEGGVSISVDEREKVGFIRIQKMGVAMWLVQDLDFSEINVVFNGKII